jgi:hypothetical protein
MSSTVHTWDKNLLVSPVELELMIPSERIHHGSYRRLGATADKVKVQHRLYSPGLHAPHDSLGLGREEGFGPRGP